MLAVCINHRNLTNKPEVTAQPQDSTEATNWTKTRRNRGSGEAETPCSLPRQLRTSEVSGDHYGMPGGRATIPASCSPRLDFLSAGLIQPPSDLGCGSVCGTAMPGLHGTLASFVMQIKNSTWALLSSDSQIWSFSAQNNNPLPPGIR